MIRLEGLEKVRITSYNVCYTKLLRLHIGVQCLRIAIAGFVVPYMAVYTPALMLQDGGPLAEAIGYVPAVCYVLAKALISVGLWGIASIGFFEGKLPWWQRLWAAGSAFMLIAALPVTDELGFLSSVAFIAFTIWRIRRARAAEAG